MVPGPKAGLEAPGAPAARLRATRAQERPPKGSALGPGPLPRSRPPRQHLFQPPGLTVGHEAGGAQSAGARRHLLLLSLPRPPRLRPRLREPRGEPQCRHHPPAHSPSRALQKGREGGDVSRPPARLRRRHRQQNVLRRRLVEERAAKPAGSGGAGGRRT